jgi:preprotein translocase SecE subunit
VAKSRAQRKAERRKREAQEARQAQAERRDESRAQHDTQVPESADVIEAELAERGADVDALREEGESSGKTKAPAPSRADVGKPADSEPEAPKESRRERKRREREEAQAKEERRQAREKSSKPEVVERQRGAVTGFIASCWAELKRVQWPDRDTLVQASAVTILFVAVMATYLGVLDGIFSRLVDLFIS